MKRFLLAAVILLIVGCGMATVAVQAQGYGHSNGEGGPPPNIVWNGSVDNTVNVFVQGSHEWSVVVRGKGVGHEGCQVLQPLPNAPVNVYLTHVHGRGRVHVFQEPHRSNNYTVGIRVHDPQWGRGDYSFGLNW